MIKELIFQIIFNNSSNSSGDEFHDVALIRLEESIELSAKINAICLPDETLVVEPGRVCKVAGI